MSLMLPQLGVASGAFVAPGCVARNRSVFGHRTAANPVRKPEHAVRWHCCSTPPPAPPPVPKASAPEAVEPADGVSYVSSAPPARRGSEPYSLNARLREETEAPFRKFRQFLYAGSGMSAAVGGFIALTRVIAGVSGVRGTQTVAEAGSNLAIDVAGAAFCFWLWYREQKAGDRRLERMRRGARIAALTVKEPVSGRVVRISEFRKQARVVIVAAPKDKLVSTMLAAQKVKDDLAACQVMVAPFEIGDAQPKKTKDAVDWESTEELSIVGEMPRGSWIATPADNAQWGKWLAAERELSSSSSVTDDNVFVVILRMNGKVGSRSLGAPKWDQLAEEVRNSPINDAPPKKA